MNRTPIRISVSISSHGYGHLIQTLAVLEMLKARNNNFVLRIQSTHNPTLIKERFGHFNIKHDRGAWDGGLVQHDPINVDLPATFEHYSRLHQNFELAVAQEMQALKEWSADLVLSDISGIALAAAAQTGIPGIAIASLSWEHIVQAYFDLRSAECASWYTQLSEAYASATVAILPEPSLPSHSFPSVKNVPPILLRGKPIPTLRHQLGLDPADRRPLIFCGLGGIPSAHLPLEAMQSERDFHWLVDHDSADIAENIHCLRNPKKWAYRDLTASIDGVVGKPGYCMAVEAAAYNLPFVFTRRGHFPDEAVICTWLSANARTAELSNSDWFAGQFGEPLKYLFESEAPATPLCDGAEASAKIIEQFL